MSEKSKKILAKQIKEDLQKDLEKAKKSEKNKNDNYDKSWAKTLGESCTDYRGNEWRLTYFGSIKNASGKKYNEKRSVGGRGWIEVFPEELEPNDWKEIESLIQQIEKLEKELENKKNQEWESQSQERQNKINQKLSSNPKMFFYEGKWEWSDYDDIRHVFSRVENGQNFHLVFPENHPAANSLLSPKKYPNSQKQGILCLIEGAENIPLEKKIRSTAEYAKILGLTDQITITPVDNSVYIETLQANKAYSERYLVGLQAEQAPEEEIAYTKKRIKEYEEEIQEEKNWLAQNGNISPTPLKNEDNSPNSQPKELKDKTLLSYFQKNNIKSIRLWGECGKITIKRNDNSTFDDVLSNIPLSNELYELLKKSVDKTVSRHELEVSGNNTTSPVNKSNKGLYISLAVVGVLVVGIISWLLLRNKNKQK